MAGSSSNHRELSYECPYPYPYPSNVFIPSLVTVKLTGRDIYDAWETQIICQLGSHSMLSFIYGRPSSSVSRKEKESDPVLWRRSDALVKGWILGSLSEQALKYVVNLLKETNTHFTAKDVWDKLRTVYGPILQQDFDDEEEMITREEESEIQVNSVSHDTKSYVEEKTEEEKREEENKKAGEMKQAEKEKQQTEKEKKKADELAKLHQSLYEATLSQSIEEVTKILAKKVKVTDEIIINVAVTDRITINGNTALHVAIGNTKEREFLEKMLSLESKPKLLNMKNADGSTLLHVAAIVGNIDAAKLLVENYNHSLFIQDKKGDTPLHKALSNMHTETYLYLFEATSTRDKEMAATLFSGSSGDELLVNAVSSKNYDSALKLSEKYPTVHSDAMLMAIAQNFPPELTTLQRIVHHFLNCDYDATLKLILILCIVGIAISVIVFLIKHLSKTMRVAVLLSWGGGALIPITGLYYAFKFIGKVLKKSFQMIVRLICKMNEMLESSPAVYRIYKPFQRKIGILALRIKFVQDRAQSHNKAEDLLRSICSLIKRTVASSSYQKYYTNAILEATKQNACEVVIVIVSYFPNAIWSVNEHGHNIIQHAVVNRSERVYNLLYQMNEHKNVYKTIKDPFENNLLHLAGKLAPPEKLNLISGAALQIQHELQWFKEVESFVCPLNIIQKNSFGETPQMIFTREHKDLVIEGEKWMKSAAESYTITAALITTIVFAAAITVPGGNNQDTGFPVFTDEIAFTIFAVSDAVSYFSAVTSLLMFLSILTARFAEQDFLYSLPKKMIIGLVALFISTTTMIIAFGATLYLVFGQKKSWIIYPIGALTLLPIIFFVTLQYPLIADLVRSTYGRSIFDSTQTEISGIDFVNRVERFVVTGLRIVVNH